LKSSVLNDMIGGPGHHHGLRVAVVARARLDAVAVDRLAAATIAVATSAWPTSLVAAELLPQQLGEHVGRHAAPRELAEEAAVFRDRPEHLEERVTGHRRAVPGTLTEAVATHADRKKSSNSRSFIRYFSTLPFLTLNSGGWR
jgi:hypothetical protein